MTEVYVQTNILKRAAGILVAMSSSLSQNETRCNEITWRLLVSKSLQVDFPVILFYST